MDNTLCRISKMCSQLTAPLVDNYIQTLNRNSSIVNENTIKIMKELFAELKLIKSCGDDERRELWLEVPKGTIADFGDYETAKEYGDVENYEEFEKWWKEEYPDDVYWYHLVTLENEGYMAVFLKNRMVLEVNPHLKEEQYDRLGDAVNPFVEWLTASVKCCINQMLEGTYNEYVKTHLTPENRTGTIIRNDYWRAFPEVKENYLKNFSKSDYDEFIRLMDGVKDKPSPNGRLETMTSGLFFHCCALGYEANHFQGCELPPKEQYLKHADGRDEGLCGIDENSPSAFETWYNDRMRYGGHPWEVCRGGNSTHVDLYVMRDEKGYYFYTAGNAWNRSVEAAHFYLSIYRAGYPVTIRDGRAMADRFLGVDRIGIVPAGVIPNYCESYFPGEKILDFMNLDKEDEEKILEYIIWQDIPEQNLG